jgi:hypothetical protein
MLTAAFRQTDVLGARVAVVTLQAAISEALALVADIISSAGVEVVTGGLVELMHAARFRITTVIGADIAIFTVEQTLAHAFSIAAEIADCAGIPIIAGLLVGNLDAPGDGVAAISCTEILIITAKGLSPQTQAASTLIGYGAEVPIVAKRVIGSGNASGSRVTATVSANVTIVTLKYPQPHAIALLADVTGGTGATVIAGQGVVLVETAVGRVAKVRSTGIAVIAVSDGPCDAFSFCTLVTDGTSAAILATASIVCGNDFASSRTGVTEGRKTGAGRVVTFYYGLREDSALVRHLSLVAIERTVALVAVFKSSAITAFLAVAGSLVAATTPLDASIFHGAGITIVAVNLIVRVNAATGGVAFVVSAKIPIVAIDD